MNEHHQSIRAAKEKLGDELVILAHHYQRADVVSFGDFKGDSYVLAQKAASCDAQKIVFCGVHFMAESARILARPEQQVFMPDTRAGCPMADMADADDARVALERIREVAGDKTVVPITYINSTAEVKALVGEHGGIVCTSSNAPKAFEWARSRGEVIFFLPDEFLGRNTARRMSARSMVLWNPYENNGGLTDQQLHGADVVLWRGYCHVHTYFNPPMIEAQRARHPDCQIVVHPECTPEVVDAADADGSTAFIVQFVDKAGPGSTVVVGTEVNLVLRLAKEYPDRTVLPLDHSVCPNMYRTNVEKLARLLDGFDPALEITVDEEVGANAKLALTRMLEL
jgi:quinolinate synthase